MKLYVYCLQDPRNSKVRYVGLSKNPQKRLKFHLRPNRYNSDLFDWIRSLANAGLLPAIRVLEECPGEAEGMVAERCWIDRLKQDLLNQNGGGHYHVWSEEARKRASETAKRQKRIPPPQSVETKARIAQRNRERGQPREVQLRDTAGRWAKVCQVKT